VLRGRSGRPPCSILWPFQKLRHFGDVDRDAPSFITRKQVGCGAPAGLALIVDVCERNAVVIAQDETGGVRVLDRPQRWETAGIAAICVRTIDAVRGGAAIRFTAQSTIYVGEGAEPTVAVRLWYIVTAHQ
jgi:hypothetical protein